MTTRWTVKMFVLIAAALGIGIAAAAAAPVLPSHELKGIRSATSIMSTCLDNNGTFFNSPNGGYGCAGTQGTVNCTSKGKCTGTCQACRQAGPSGPGVGHPVNPVGNVQPPSVKPPGQGHPVIPGGIRPPVSNGSALPPSAGAIALYSRGGHGKR